MENWERTCRRAVEFCQKQTSIKAAVENFIEQFSDLYEDEGKKEQEILAQCVGQMFRKYYYAVLLPVEILTPAGITNTLCEREFGNDVVAVPNPRVVYIGSKIRKIDYRIVCFSAQAHPFLADLELFLKIAATGIGMEAPGIPLSGEYASLQENLFLYDRHYINMLGLIALEAGLLECRESAAGLIGRRTARAVEFCRGTTLDKLQTIIANALQLCSKSLTAAFPELRKEFAVANLTSLLHKSKNYERFMQSVFKKVGVDPTFFTPYLMVEELAELVQVNPAAQEKVAKLYLLFTLLDMYFFTPFGFYLQMLQPVYPEVYDAALEMDRLLADLNDFHAIRMKLFAPVIEYDLTALGEVILADGEKPRRKQVIPREVGDAEMSRIVHANLEYLEFDAYNDSEDDGDDGYDDEEDEEGYGIWDDGADMKDAKELQLQLENFLEPIPNQAKGKGQLIDFQARKEATAKKGGATKTSLNATLKATQQATSLTKLPVTKLSAKKSQRAKQSTKTEAAGPSQSQIFVFKIKCFEAKRIWRQIEIEGSQTLHDLNEAALAAFQLEPGHLYSFFMANRFWDKHSEYSHPQAEGRSARKIKIAALDLHPKQKFCYLYDYGDEYRFEVELVAIAPSEPGADYPRETKRNKPAVTVCEQCQSDQAPIEWYCHDHQMYLCDKCAESKKHDECFIGNALL